MTTGKNGGGSRFFGALASRLGLGVVQTDVFQEGDHEVHEYRGVLGLRFRRRKPVGHAHSLDSAVAPVIEPNASHNGHAPQHSESLTSLALQLKDSAPTAASDT